MPRDEKLSALTRSLIIGASISTLALAGCVTQEQAEAQLPQVVQTLPSNEAGLFRRASERKDPRSVNTFLRRYPNSRGVVPLLSALPCDTNSALSPRAVAGIPEETRRRLPQRVTSCLPQVEQRQRRQQQVVARPQQQQTQRPTQRQQNRPASRQAGFAQFY